MTGEHSAKIKQRRICWVLGIGGALAVIAEAKWILDILHNVLNGNALATLSLTPWIHVSYMGALVIFVLGVSAVVCGLFIGIRDWWEIRELKQRYGEKRGAP
jgi:hypothetical protein